MDEQITQFLLGGGKWIQLRMKNSSMEEVELEATLCIDSIEDKNGTLIINDYPEISHIAGKGVHLGKNDLSIAQARQLLGKDYIIGGTANNLEEYIKLCENEDCDYIGLGPLHFTGTKTNLSPVLGIEEMKKIIQHKKNKFVVAVGGIKFEDLNHLRDIGVDGVAVSSLIAKSENIKNITKELLEQLSKW